MGYKVFVSYKYGDNNVKMIYKYNKIIKTSRDYVDILMDEIGKDNIYKGEENNEDLSHLSEDTIWEKLKDKIYDSSITIVLITPNMIDRCKTEEEQWIPWEISYSLKEITRGDRISRVNGIICVAIPDRNNSYDYVLPEYNEINRKSLFPIIKNNMKNIKYSLDLFNFDYDESYIDLVKWDDFITNINTYLKKAKNKSEHSEMYDLHKLTLPSHIY